LGLGLGLGLGLELGLGFVFMFVFGFVFGLKRVTCSMCPWWSCFSSSTRCPGHHAAHAPRSSCVASSSGGRGAPHSAQVDCISGSPPRVTSGRVSTCIPSSPEAARRSGKLSSRRAAARLAASLSRVLMQKAILTLAAVMCTETADLGVPASWAMLRMRPRRKPST